MKKINSRNKGNSYERTLAKEYRELGFVDCITSRAGGKAIDDCGIDLMFTSPFLVQAKNYKAFPIAKAIQALNIIYENIEKPIVTSIGSIPIAHIKITGQDEVVVIKKKEWFKILEKYMNNH